MKKPDGWKNLGTYNRYQASEFGRFVKRLKKPEPNGNGSLPDNTLHAWFGIEQFSLVS